MKRCLIFLMIFVLVPVFTSAHEGHGEEVLAEAETRAGVLPGELAYPFDRMGEWFELNLFTLSTKRKQEKKLGLTGERLAEFAVLVEKFPDKVGAIEKSLKGYEKYLSEARDMAEKIIFLDGTEIALAEKVEEKSRVQEGFFVDLLRDSDPGLRPYINQAISIARIENEIIFKYMVANYQGTDEEVEKHKQILEEHLRMIESRFLLQSVIDELGETNKFKDAGLNDRAYDYLKTAKNVLYSELVSR